MHAAATATAASTLAYAAIFDGMVQAERVSEEDEAGEDQHCDSRVVGFVDLLVLVVIDLHVGVNTVSVVAPLSE